MWPATVLSLFFPCRNYCAENFVIFFYEIKLLVTLLTYPPPTRIQPNRFVILDTQIGNSHNIMFSSFIFGVLLFETERQMYRSIQRRIFPQPCEFNCYKSSCHMSESAFVNNDEVWKVLQPNLALFCLFPGVFQTLRRTHV